MTVDSGNHNRLRRTVLKTLGGASVVALAGCSGDGGDGGGGDGGSGDGGGGDGGGGDGGGGDGGDTTTWTFGTSREGSLTYSVGQAMQSVVRENSDQVRLSAELSAGSVGNLYDMDAGNYEMAHTIDVTYNDAHQGQGEYEGDVPQNPGEQMFTWLSTEYGFVQPADSDIESWSDLAGRSVAAFPSGFTAGVYNQLIFEALGIEDEVNRVDIEVTEHAAALGNRADAVGMQVQNNGASTTGAMQQVTQQNDVKQVPMTEEEKQLIEDEVGVPIVTIDSPPESLQGLEELDMWSIHGVFVLQSDLSPDTVQHALNVLVDNADDVQSTVDGIWDYSDEEQFTRGLQSQYPIHQGVQQFLDERGWTVE